MKIANFSHRGETRLGIVDETAGKIRPIEPRLTDMVALVERYDALKASLSSAGAGLELSSVTLLAPFLAPRRNIFCVGKNYREHAKEFSQSGYDAGAAQGAGADPYPIVFTKPASCVVGPGATVSLHPEATDLVDYEAELAFIVGVAGKNIKKADAYRHVWGYTCINDVTARDRQMNHKQWFLGKALDGFCPMGPWVTTADEVDPENLDIKCWVNGDLRQSANTRDLIFDIPTLVETISQGLTLQPGDIVATGTPAGVGIGFTPPKFLKSGDKVTVSIAGLGTLTNTFA